MEYFDYGRDAESFLDDVSSWDFDVDEFLKQSREKQRRRLQAGLKRIDRELEKRDQIQEELVGELESQLEIYVDELEQVYRSFFAGKQVEEERLKERVRDIEQRIQSEKRSHWRDRQDLEEERRQLLQELEELKDSQLEDLL